MTLRDFRQRGRLGCPKDYEIFGAQLRDLLERIHGAARHVGRSPNSDEATSCSRSWLPRSATKPTSKRRSCATRSSRSSARRRLRGRRTRG
jgi:hypothetical protein